MTQKSKDYELKLYTVVDEVLHYIWDPIGISGIPEARDEYYSYIPLVITILRRSSDFAEIADMLQRVESERMGLTPNNERCAEVAKSLLEWRRYLGNQHA